MQTRENAGIVGEGTPYTTMPEENGAVLRTSSRFFFLPRSSQRIDSGLRELCAELDGILPPMVLVAFILALQGAYPYYTDEDLAIELVEGISGSEHCVEILHAASQARCSTLGNSELRCKELDTREIKDARRAYCGSAERTRSLLVPPDNLTQSFDAAARFRPT